jgi:hypothetical protein
MPRLREYVSVGICAGYGDGDYRVSMTVADLSIAEMNELRKAFIFAIAAAEQMWRDEQMKKPENRACAASHGDSIT